MRTRFFSLGIVGLLVTVALWSGSVIAQETLPTFDELTNGWNVLAPGGETTCALGDPYRFMVYPGNTHQLVIHFEAGTACIDAEICKNLVDNAKAYNLDVPDDDWRAYRYEIGGFRENEGVLSMDHPENPFQDYTAVFVPDCTSDALMGNALATYEHGGEAFTIQHNGYINASTALEWVFDNITAPDSVVLTSCSSGVAAQLFQIPNILDHYSSVIQIGVSASDLRFDYSALFAHWGATDVIASIPMLADIPLNQLNIVRAYAAAAALSPNSHFSAVDMAFDPDQIASEETVPATHSELRAAAPNIRTWIGGDANNCIIYSPVFYTHKVGDLRFRDWVAVMIAGEAVEDVQCTGCPTAE